MGRKLEHKDTGDFVVTRGIAELFEESIEFSLFVDNCIERYLNCDFGDLCDIDKELNDRALINNDERLFASYHFPENSPWECPCDKIWIMTERDHSVTTVLLPIEY